MPVGSDGRTSLAVLLTLVAATGCSLTTTDVQDCDNNATCRAAFGLGSVCGKNGFCETAPPSPRCQETFPGDLLSRPEDHQGAIVFGNLMDRSVAAHQAREKAVRLAASQLNDVGGLEGDEVAIVFCTIEENIVFDGLDRTEAAVASALHLSDDLGVPAIVGPAASTDTVEVFSALSSSGTLIISPSATSPALIGLDTAVPTDRDPGLLWRTAPPDTIQGSAISEFLLSQNVMSVAVIHEQGAYGQGLQEAFLTGFLAGGGMASLYQFANAAERDANVVAAGGEPVDYVLFASGQFTDVVAFLNAAGGLASYDGKGIFLTDTADTLKLLTDAGSGVSLFPNIRGSRPAVPTGPVHDVFRASYRAAYNEESTDHNFTAHAYDAAWLTFLGSAWSLSQEGALSGVGIARGLRKVSDGTPLTLVPSNFGAAATSFRSGLSVDVSGASGELDYDPATEETSSAIDIWGIAPTNDAIVVIDTLQP